MWSYSYVDVAQHTIGSSYTLSPILLPTPWTNHCIQSIRHAAKHTACNFKGRAPASWSAEVFMRSPPKFQWNMGLFWIFHWICFIGECWHHHHHYDSARVLHLFTHVFVGACDVVSRRGHQHLCRLWGVFRASTDSAPILCCHWWSGSCVITPCRMEIEDSLVMHFFYKSVLSFERELTQLTFNTVVAALGEISDFQSSRAKWWWMVLESYEKHSTTNVKGWLVDQYNSSQDTESSHDTASS